jgi:alanine-glyoxylate transaminase/serine-glyoxylate transaminase/serine-pyruvate transaminase
MVSVSERGFQAMPAEEQIHGWYLNLRTWAWYEKEWGDWHPYPITLPVNLYLALKKAMELVLEEGLEQAWERHRRVSGELQEALLELGISLFIASKEHRSYTVTGALLPEGLESEELQRFLRQHYGILIAGGVGPLRKRIFRVGHMGYSAQSWLVNRVVAGIERFLQKKA